MKKNVKNKSVIRYFSIICFFVIANISSSDAQSPDSFYAQELQFQLSSPSIISEFIFFEKENNIRLVLDHQDVRIHYTLDGNEPTEASPIFTDQIILNQSAIIKAKAFHHQYLASETVESHFIKLGNSLPIKNISLNQAPNENYLGTGAQGLIDRQKGTTDFRTAYWMGFTGEDLEATIEFKHKASFQKVIVSLLSDQNSWIFPPETVEIYTSDDGENFKLLSTQDLKPTLENTSNQLIFSEIEFPETSANFIKVLLKNIPEIPEWHPGKGKAPWLFIDEILVE